MILGDLSDTKRVEALHPLLGKLFSYIKEHDFLSDSIGRIELDGDRVFINNDYPVLRSQSEPGYRSTSTLPRCACTS